MRIIQFKIFLIIGILLSNSQLKAQLSGNYTIGGTTGANNYATWSDFVACYRDWETESLAM